MKQKRKLSKSDNTVAKNVRGRPITLSVNRKAEVGSNSACASTIRYRSWKFEAFQLISLVPARSCSNTEAIKDDLVSQQSSLIKRQKEIFLSDSHKARITLMKNFKLQANTVLGLKKEMPLSMWKLIKRGLQESLGVDVMGKETELKKQLDCHGNFDYECGLLSYMRGR